MTELDDRVARIEAILADKEASTKLAPLLEAARSKRAYVLKAVRCGVKQKSIAAALGVTPSNISSMYARALREEYIGEEEITVESFLKKLDEICTTFEEKMCNTEGEQKVVYELISMIFDVLNVPRRGHA